MAECKENVGRGVVNFPCNLEPKHEGPHMARENEPSKAARALWERQNGKKSTAIPHPGVEPLSAFQGPPKTAAEGLMEPHILTVDTNRPGEGRTLHTTYVPQRTKVDQTIWADETAEIEADLEARGESNPVISALGEIWDEPEPTKQRDGDQVLPTVNDEAQYIQDIVCDDIQARKAVGVDRYGTGLQTFNGRDADRDLYEELLDALMYQKQRQIERAQLVEVVLDLHGDLERILGSLPADVYDNLAFLYAGLKP
jgi:hypothetical protein